MMHYLLKKQIREHLPSSLRKNAEVIDFLKSIQNSYRDYDKKLIKIKKNTSGNFKKPSKARKEVEKEKRKQENTLIALEDAINHLSENVIDKKFLGLDGQALDIEILANKIRDFAEEVVRISLDKDKLLKNLEVRNTDLNNYAHMVSHDLRSPLRNISALMSWIIEEEGDRLSEPSKKNSILVMHNLEKMDKLINGILQHATIGTTDEVKSSFSFKELIDEICLTLYIPDNIKITIIKDGPRITFERLRMKLLFTNLFTNSIRATEHMQEAKINISYEENVDYMAFSFSDNGKGIAKEHQSKIFEMFRKLENDASTTGIGLALVKKIVQHYQGLLRIESKINKGTTIHFTLKKEL